MSKFKQKEIKLSPQFAKACFAFLVEVGSANPDDEVAFTSYLTKENIGHEFRFQGVLGFGGKFHTSPYREMPISVSCYCEERSFERDDLMNRLNEGLAKLWQAFYGDENDHYLVDSG